MSFKGSKFWIILPTTFIQSSNRTRRPKAPGERRSPFCSLGGGFQKTRCAFVEGRIGGRDAPHVSGQWLYNWFRMVFAHREYRFDKPEKAESGKASTVILFSSIWNSVICSGKQGGVVCSFYEVKFIQTVISMNDPDIQTFTFCRRKNILLLD